MIVIRRTARRPTTRHKRQLAIGLAVVAALVLLVFPLQTIVSAILAGSLWIISMALLVWMERNLEARDRDQILRATPFVAAGAVALGVALTFAVTMTMAFVTLVLAVVAAGSMVYLTLVERAVKAEQWDRWIAEDDARFEQPERKAA